MQRKHEIDLAKKILLEKSLRTLFLKENSKDLEETPESDRQSSPLKITLKRVK